MPLEVAGVKMYNSKEISKLLGLSLQATRRYLREGKIAAKKIGGNRYYVSEDALREYLNTPDNTPQSKGNDKDG